jgi:N-acyl-D-amino-acid deacylase
MSTIAGDRNAFMLRRIPMPPCQSRRTFIKQGATATLGFALFPFSRIQPATSFDVVIKGGTLLDGTGAPPWSADLGLIGDAIAATGSIAPEQGKIVIDASGLHISPGFIDIHTHSDSSILRYPTADSRILQGVTTEITGNCGYAVAPLTGEGVEEMRKEMKGEYGLDISWTDVASYFEVLETMGMSVNHALLLGQGSLRNNAIGPTDRPLTDDELKSVLRSLEEGMEQGAIGLSTGLEYVPGRFTPTEEIIAMARVVGRSNGLYASHLRNEETALLAAVDEAIQIGQTTGVRVEISHLKAAGGPNWSKQRAALHLIESARRDGIDVLADAYPYTAYSTGLTIFMPAWAMDGGWPALAKRLEDPSDRGRIRDELIQRVQEDPGDFNLIVISSLRTEANQPLVGKDLTQIAEQWKVEPIDALLRLVVEEEGSVGFIGHGMSPDNVELVLSHPLVMVGSDGGSMAPEGPAAKTRPHPRSYGTFARILGHYAREQKLFDLPTAIKKMTSMPADQTGLHDRGRIARGKKADLVIFNAKTVKDVATFDDPHRFAIGIEHVLVNGQIVVENSEHTGKRPGKVLRKA